MAKQLPQALQTEQALLGAMINDPHAILNVSDQINEDDFFHTAHQKIYRAIIKLNETKEQINALLVAQTLEDRGELAMIGGLDYIEQLMEEGYQSYLAEDYAGILKEKSMRRQLILAAEEIIERSYSEEEASGAVEHAEKKIFDISQSTQKRDLTSAKAIVEEVNTEIRQRQSLGTAFVGQRSFFEDLDAKTNGLQKSSLILIAARPSMGKTAFGMNIAENVAIRGHKHVCVFSLEMSKEQLMYRMLASQSMVTLEKVIKGDLDTDDWKNLIHATKNIAASHLYVDDTPAITVHEIRSKLRKYKTRHKALDLVVIDYLQLMRGGSRHENRQLEISSISRGLKELAKEMQCPIIALSQLSREPEKRSNHRPMLSDLRESGAIEQDADLVMFIYRDAVYHENEADPNKAEIIIAKQRNGEVGTILLTWMGAYTKFQNYVRER